MAAADCPQRSVRPFVLMLFLEEVWQAGQPDSVHCVLYRDDIYTSAVWEELKADVGRILLYYLNSIWMKLVTWNSSSSSVVYRLNPHPSLAFAQTANWMTNWRKCRTTMKFLHRRFTRFSATVTYIQRRDF